MPGIWEGCPGHLKRDALAWRRGGGGAGRLGGTSGLVAGLSSVGYAPVRVEARGSAERRREERCEDADLGGVGTFRPGWRVTMPARG